MSAVIALFGFIFVCAIALAVFAAAISLIKIGFHVILWPFKLLFLPILAIVLIIKLTVLLAIGAVLAAVLLPIIILFLIFAAPFLLAASIP